MSEPEPIRRLLADHVAVIALLDRLEAAFTGAAPAAYPPVIAQAVRFFEYELPLHIDQEDGGLFPPLEEHLGRDSGPCAVMRAEHEEITALGRAFVRLAARDFGAESWQEMARVSRDVSNILREHLFKEEQILFPMSQRLLSPEAFAAINERMDAAAAARAA